MGQPVYKKELSRSYLVLENESEEKREAYPYRMLLKNRIPGLLPCDERFFEGRACLYYDVSSCQSLSRVYETKWLGSREIKGIVEQLTQVLDAMAGYLLEEENLLLEPDYIYMDLETEQLYFLCDPVKEEEKGRLYLPLAEFFLEKVDHREDCAVRVAYQFYKMSKVETFTASGFKCYLEKEGQTQEQETESVERPLRFIDVEQGDTVDLSRSHDGGTAAMNRSESAERGAAEPEESARGEAAQRKAAQRKAPEKKAPEEGQDRHRGEREVQKTGGWGFSLAGLVVTALLFLALCAAVWYLQPVGRDKWILFGALAADGLILLSYLWRVTTWRFREEEETVQGSAASA